MPAFPYLEKSSSNNRKIYFSCLDLPDSEGFSQLTKISKFADQEYTD